MARIRSIKPEFFDSPSTAACSPWARLLYIAMWCLADDWGIGQANMKELAAFAFPNDDQWTSKELPSLCKEVAAAYGTVFYTHHGRTYYAIPSWDEHQVTQRRAQRRYPPPDDPQSVADLRFCQEADAVQELPSVDKESASTEQGNRGTGEQGNRTARAASASRRKPETPIPEDWQPNDRHREQARTRHVDIDREAFRFRNHAEANDRRVRDWDAAFRNWLDKAEPSTSSAASSRQEFNITDLRLAGLLTPDPPHTHRPRP